MTKKDFLTFPNIVFFFKIAFDLTSICIFLNIFSWYEGFLNKICYNTITILVVFFYVYPWNFSFISCLIENSFKIVPTKKMLHPLKRFSIKKFSFKNWIVFESYFTLQGFSAIL